MRAEYDTFVDSLGDLVPGQEIRLTIRALTPGRQKYEGRYVRAIVSPSPESLPGADVLWVRFQRGWRHPQPWAIKVVGVLGEFKPHKLRAWD